MNPSERPPVILLHGIVAQSYSWRGVMAALAKQGLRAIAPDWIGQGFSDKPEPRDFAYTPDAFVTAFSDWLKVLEIERFSLVVQGFASSAGLLYAAEHPDQIERLIILNTPLTRDAKLPWKLKQMSIPLVGDMLTQDPLLVDRTLEGGGPYVVEDADLDVYRRPFLTSSDAGRALLATIKRLNLKETMARLEQGFSDWQPPTLIVWGTEDKWLPVSMAETFAQRLHSVDIAKLEAVGHYAQEDWSEKVSDAMVPFLRRQIL